ncbi:MAG: ilvD 1, partial [Myxococcales bacterium]|nr:ilvD 1 [Myxococcales bacterium]
EARHVPLLSDARFSGLSTGPCIGHVSPEALAGGPLGKLRDGDRVRVEIDTRGLRGTIDLVAEDGAGGWRADDAEVAGRAPRADLAADPDLPADTRLWAALQSVSGGPWRGSVYDVPRILEVIEAGRRALDAERPET